MPTVHQKLNLARRHLEKLQSSWEDEPDLDDLAFYGLYCLEAAVEAAALHVGIKTEKQHWDKKNAADELYKRHGLPEIGDLLFNLNDTRKAVAYGDVEEPDLDEDNAVVDIENYVQAVEDFIGSVGRPHLINE